MGQATRTTKLLLDLGKRTQGGTNTSKRGYLEATVELLNAARTFYKDQPQVETSSAVYST
jgi:hypothetical protein